MKKLFSLIKASMSENMSLFKVKTKSEKGKFILPIFLFLVILGYMGGYAFMIIEPLKEVHMEYVMLTIFAIFTIVLTFFEGIYKSGNLIFNCKDDDMLLSLPIRKSTVLFIRVLKFYVFEFLYNLLFLLGPIIVYAIKVDVGLSYYVVSAFMLLLLPIIPIVVSCIIGGFITFFASRFKRNNIAQTFFTLLILLVVLYLSFNLDGYIHSLAENAESINEIVTKVYYPVGAYVGLVLDFNIIDLLVFIVINVGIFAIAIFVLSKLYFKINTSVKSVKIGPTNSNYKIKTSNITWSLIKKEFNRFINSPVFVINAGFGVVLYVAGCILLSIKFTEFGNSLIEQGMPVPIESLMTYLPAIIFVFLCFSSLMTSITSSMISLERKSFNILKSLPVSPFRIIMAKVLTAFIIMIPFLLIGNIVVFIRFGFSILQVLILLAASVVIPFVAEIFGIMINLKYPKMDAENDTEVVKQSMSTMVSVFAGLIVSGITMICVFRLLDKAVNPDLILILGLGVYTVILAILIAVLKVKSVKYFNKINV